MRSWPRWLKYSKLFGGEPEPKTKRNPSPSKTRFVSKDPPVYEAEEQDSPNYPRRGTVGSRSPRSIIHQLAEEHLFHPQVDEEGAADTKRGMGRLTSSQVEEFEAKETGEFEDPIGFWAKQASREEGLFGSGGAAFPESIRVRGQVFELVPVN